MCFRSIVPIADARANRFGSPPAGLVSVILFSKPYAVTLRPGSGQADRVYNLPISGFVGGLVKVART